MSNSEFRGKSKDTNQWIFGHGFFVNKAIPGNPVFVYSDIDCNWYEVIPETVCRYTGFIAGEKIYEDDIGCYQFVDSEERFGKIEWKDGRWIVGDIGSLYCVVQYLKIIGNIHDNSKLLQGEKNDIK
jgi:hypothetical protein